MNLDGYAYRPGSSAFELPALGLVGWNSVLPNGLFMH